MNLIIFGASGRTGRTLIEQAKAQGHRITAFARNPDASLSATQGIKVVRGDLLDAAAVARATQGYHVILSAVGVAGSNGRSATTLFSQGMKHIVAAAKLAGARRILAVGSCGVDPGTKAPFPLNILAKLIVRPLLQGVYDDMARMEAGLAKVELDWTVLRPPYLTQGRLTKQYRTAINQHLPGIARISRADLAHCMLGAISNEASYRAWMEVAY